MKFDATLSSTSKTRKVCRKRNCERFLTPKLRLQKQSKLGTAHQREKDTKVQKDQKGKKNTSLVSLIRDLFTFCFSPLFLCFLNLYALFLSEVFSFFVFRETSMLTDVYFSNIIYGTHTKKVFFKRIS